MSDMEFKKVYINIWITTFRDILEILAKLFSINPKNTTAYSYLRYYYHDKFESWTISQKNEIETMLNCISDIHRTSILNLKKEMVSLKILLKWFREVTFNENKEDIMLREPEELTKVFENLRNYGEIERVDIETNINAILKIRENSENNILEKFNSMYEKCDRLMFL